MLFISLNDFLAMFSQIHSDFDTLENFYKHAKVKTSKRTILLTEYIIDKSISNEDIQLIYENFVKRNAYLTRFYKVSLQIGSGSPISINKCVKAMPIDSIDNNSLVIYKNIIRNMFFKDILQNTKSGLENLPTFFDVLYDFYIYGIIDYKILTPSSLFYIKQNRLGSVFSSFYFRASIMNPIVPYSINQSYLNGKRIFSPTLGWGSYCYGFLECPLVEEYVGTDVIPDVCQKTEDFAKQFYGNKQTTIFCKQSENLIKDDIFKEKYCKYFDTIFFSPPYYCLEIYSGENQSTEKYKSYEEWLKCYWTETMKLCHWVLQKGGKMCYILSGYGSDNKKGSYDLLNDMNDIAELQFAGSPIIFEMKNKNANMTKHRRTSEKIIIFKKL